MTRLAGRETLTGNPARGRRFVRPISPFVPLVSCAGVLLAWGLVAHNSGAGWVQAVGDVLAGVLGVGLVAPAVVAAGARVAIVETPSDGTSGLPVELAATANNRLRVRPLDPPGPEAFVGPHRMPASPRPGRRPWATWRGDATSMARSRSPSFLHTEACTTASSSRSPRPLPSASCGGARPSSSSYRVLHVGPRLGPPLPLPGGRTDTTGGDILRRRGPDR